MKKLILLWLPVTLIACQPLSESEADDAAGLNGSFEVCKNNLPVNWQVYTRKSVGKGDFSTGCTTGEFVDGKQSFFMHVKACSNQGGRLSPGLAREIKIEPEKTYRVSVWVKSDKAPVQISLGGISAKNNSMQKHIINPTDSLFKQHVYQFTTLTWHTRARLEINALGAGDVYIDQVAIDLLK